MFTWRRVRSRQSEGIFWKLKNGKYHFNSTGCYDEWLKHWTYLEISERCFKMSEPSDTNSTLSISSDSDSAGANDETPSPVELPKINNMVQIQNAEGFAAQETGGNGRRKEDYEEYFMSVNQHKKSLRWVEILSSLPLTCPGKLTILRIFPTP